MSLDLLLILAFSVKHFVADYPMQPAWMYLNKGTYGHPGGIFHSVVHVWASLVVITMITIFTGQKFPLEAVACIVIWEYLIHYHVDLAKVQINRRMGWKCNTSERFWYLLGFDQLLHSLTYVWMTWYLTH